MDPETYYRDTAVRARVLEYCGATTTKPASAAFVVGFETGGRDRPDWTAPVPTSRLPALLARGGDIARSVWDTQHLIFFLQLNYINADRPAEPFVHPADVFLKLEPVYHAVTSVFGGLRLRARPFVTGRGYHFIGKIPLADPLVGELAALAPRTPAWLATHEARRPVGVTACIDERHARAAEGLGMLIEFAGHQIHERAGAAAIPVVINGPVVGRGLNGREAASIDFSHAGDPLDSRHIRTGFSTYQWHLRHLDIFGSPVPTEAPALTMIPRNRHSLMTLLAAGRDLRAGLDAAHAGVAIIPNVTTGVTELLGQYLASPLAAFHKTYHEARQSAAGRLPSTATPAVPPCVAASLTLPNDLLLRPEHVQHVVRDLMARGWHAAQIAALIQDRYEGDYGWRDRWQRLHAETRAEFHVRVFAGLVATGADTLVDFNCVSAQEKDLCPRTGCQYDLRRDRDRIAISQ